MCEFEESGIIMNQNGEVTEPVRYVGRVSECGERKLRICARESICQWMNQVWEKCRQTRKKSTEGTKLVFTSCLLGEVIHSSRNPINKVKTIYSCEPSISGNDHSTESVRCSFQPAHQIWCLRKENRILEYNNSKPYFKWSIY